MNILTICQRLPLFVPLLVLSIAAKVQNPEDAYLMCVAPKTANGDLDVPVLSLPFKRLMSSVQWFWLALEQEFDVHHEHVLLQLGC